MRFEGDWEVGLAEIQYPYTFHTVPEGHNEIHLNLINATKEFTKWVGENPKKLVSEGNFTTISVKCKIAPGFYSEVGDIIKAVNDSIKEVTGVSKVFEYESKTRTVKAKNNEVAVNGKYIQSCIICDRLGIQLGYPPGISVFSVKSSPYVANLKFGVPDRMIVYCDIVEPQIFGDSFARVLNSVNTLPDGEAYFARPISSYFNVPQYIPLQSKSFESVSIDIRSVDGKKMPFLYGTLSVKLHFRQILRS